MRTAGHAGAKVGGCPFAPNATGDVATEGLLYMLARSGLETGSHLTRLIETVQRLQEQRGKPASGMISRLQKQQVKTIN